MVEIAHDIDGDMVARRGIPVLKQPMKRRRSLDADVAFFEQLFGERRLESLAGLDAAARQMPARRRDAGIGGSFIHYSRPFARRVFPATQS